MMKTSVILSKEECFCDLGTFYGNVARKANIRITENTRYDCRKICVTESVQQEIWSYYSMTNGWTDEQISKYGCYTDPKQILGKLRDFLNTRQFLQMNLFRRGTENGY